VMIETRKRYLSLPLRTRCILYARRTPRCCIDRLPLHLQNEIRHII
jgi:hypothetical protein